MTDENIERFELDGNEANVGASRNVTKNSQYGLKYIILFLVLYCSLSGSLGFADCDSDTS